MLNAAPGEARPRLRILGDAGDEDEGSEPKAGTPWSMEARQRRRAYNLFMRWSRAVGDTRHMLISPSAPVVNYETLLGVIFAAWDHNALESKQLRKLLLTLLTAFIGVDQRQPGFLGPNREQHRIEALGHLNPFTMELGAGLAAVAMESHWLGSIYEWQPLLKRGVEPRRSAPGRVEPPDRRAPARQNGRHRLDIRAAARADQVHRQRDLVRTDGAGVGFEGVSLDLHRTAKVRSWVFCGVSSIRSPIRGSQPRPPLSRLQGRPRRCRENRNG